MNEAIITATQVLIMFLLLMVGFICQKTKLISDEGSKSLTNIALYIATSAIIIHSYQIDYDPSIAINLLIVTLFAFLSHGLLILFSSLAFSKKNDQYKVLRFATVFGNCSFMGIPLLSALLPENGVLYATAYITVFNILLWTYGVVLSVGKGEKLSLKKIVLSPVILSVIIGLFFFFTSIKLPGAIAKTVEYIGDLNTPLAMIVTGVFVAKSNILNSLKKLDVYLVCFIKLILVSFIMIIIMRFIPSLSMDVKMAIVVMSGVPTASTSIMFAQKYGNDAVFVGEILVISTIMSLVTLPLLIFLGTIIW